MAIFAQLSSYEIVLIRALLSSLCYPVSASKFHTPDQLYYVVSGGCNLIKNSIYSPLYPMPFLNEPLSDYGARTLLKKEKKNVMLESNVILKDTAECITN